MDIRTKPDDGRRAAAALGQLILRLALPIILVLVCFRAFQAATPGEYIEQLYGVTHTGFAHLGDTVAVHLGADFVLSFGLVSGAWRLVVEFLRAADAAKSGGRSEMQSRVLLAAALSAAPASLYAAAATLGRNRSPGTFRIPFTLLTALYFLGVFGGVLAIYAVGIAVWRNEVRFRKTLSS